MQLIKGHIARITFQLIHLWRPFFITVTNIWNVNYLFNSNRINA